MHLGTGDGKTARPRDRGERDDDGREERRRRRENEEEEKVFVFHHRQSNKLGGAWNGTTNVPMTIPRGAFRRFEESTPLDEEEEEEEALGCNVATNTEDGARRTKTGTVESRVEEKTGGLTFRHNL